MQEAHLLTMQYFWRLLHTDLVSWCEPQKEWCALDIALIHTAGQALLKAAEELAVVIKACKCAT